MQFLVGILQCCGSLALGASIGMADIVRQVEVHCSDRGNALATVWNLYTASLSVLLGKYATSFPLYCAFKLQKKQYGLEKYHQTF